MTQERKGQQGCLLCSTLRSWALPLPASWWFCRPVWEDCISTGTEHQKSGTTKNHLETWAPQECQPEAKHEPEENCTSAGQKAKRPQAYSHYLMKLPTMGHQSSFARVGNLTCEKPAKGQMFLLKQCWKVINRDTCLKYPLHTSTFVVGTLIHYVLPQLLLIGPRKKTTK